MSSVDTNEMRESFSRYSRIRESIAPAPRVGGAPRVSIIIPAHNEELRIGRTLRDYADTFGPDAEFVVVLNDCTDATGAVVRRFEEHDPRFHAIALRSAVGKGGAGCSTGVMKW